MNESIEALRKRMHPVREGHYLLGLSGGADSVALLHMMLPEVRSGQIRLEAVHVNHGLRGQESDDDEHFCSELCERVCIPLYIHRADLAGKRDEDSARKVRFTCFRQTFHEINAQGLLLAHHADDQAETFLMRLLRGSGPEGLECMRNEETTGGLHILRPMLSIRRDEIRQALLEDGIAWREDSSNLDSSFLRNRIRREVLPMLEQVSSSCTERICTAAELIALDNELLNAQAENLLGRLAKGMVLDAKNLIDEPPAIRHRVLRMWWNTYYPNRKEHTLSSSQTARLDRLLNATKGKTSLPSDTVAVRTGKYLFLQGPKESAPAPVVITGTETAFGLFRLTEGPSEGNPGDGKRSQEVPCGFTRGCVIRTRRPGDRIRPFGSQGSRKLQDYLTDRKVPEPYRDRIPLLCRNNEVLLAGGVGAGNIPEWNEQADPVRLTWQGEMPWAEE